MNSSLRTWLSLFGTVALVHTAQANGKYFHKVLAPQTLVSFNSKSFQHLVSFMFFLPLVVSYAFETSMLIRHGQGTPSKTPLPLLVGERDPVSRSVINRAMCLITWTCVCVLHSQRGIQFHIYK